MCLTNYLQCICLIIPSWSLGPLHQAEDAVEATDELYDEGETVAEEVAEYVDDENEWDDLGYNPEPATVEDNPSISEPSSTTQPEKNLLPERKASNGHWTGTPDVMSPPQRKRSFSEVEAEPDDNLSHCKSLPELGPPVITD